MSTWDNIKKFLDVKTIIIAALLVVSLIFGYMWLFRGNTASKEKVKQLQRENKILEHGIDSLTKNISMKDIQLSELQKKSEKLEKDISILEDKIKKAEINANNSMNTLNSLRKELKDTKEKIEDLKNNPPNRIGNDLLESIKNKTK